MLSLTYADVMLRLGAAIAVGALIGLDRELRGKAAGLRTVSLVSLGSAVFVISIVGSIDGTNSHATSRVIQGIITGIGFLGAGTIIRGRTGESVRGLTTAASVWLSAAMGIACGLAQWPLVIAASGLGIAILVFDPIERWLKARLAAE